MDALVMTDVVDFGVFFFQAEDGIRDLIVTGVQTCALPISRKITAAATSVVVPTRPAGMRASTSSRKAGSSRRSAVPGVRMNVGATAFTVTPWGDRKSVV